VEAKKYQARTFREFSDGRLGNLSSGEKTSHWLASLKLFPKHPWLIKVCTVFGVVSYA
jgi:hypothetical protein